MNIEIGNMNDTTEEGTRLTQEEESQINEIINRWDDTIPIVLCEECISDALRHKRRNIGRYCRQKKYDDIHCEEEYSEAFAHSPKDIQILLDIIFRLINK